MTDKNIDELYTFINEAGYPIIRRCVNCIHWDEEIKVGGGKNIGYCRLTPMFFAFTMLPTVYPMTREFYLCETHRFTNEDFLELFAKKVRMKNILKKKEDI